MDKSEKGKWEGERSIDLGGNEGEGADKGVKGWEMRGEESR